MHSYKVPAPIVIDLYNTAAVILGGCTTPDMFPNTTYASKVVTLMLDLETQDPVSYVDRDRGDQGYLADKRVALGCISFSQ